MGSGASVPTETEVCHLRYVGTYRVNLRVSVVAILNAYMVFV